MLDASFFGWPEYAFLSGLSVMIIVLGSACLNSLPALGRARARHLMEEGHVKLTPYVASPLGYVLTGHLLETLGVAGLMYGGWGILAAFEQTSGRVWNWAFLVLVFLVCRLIGFGLGRADERRTAERVVTLMRPFFWCLRPLTWLLERVMGRAGGRDERFADAERVEEELEVMLDESTRRGGLEDVKGRIMRSAMDYSDTTVREVMVPRTELTACSVDATVEEALEMFIGEGYSRLPVYEGNIDTIVGVLIFRDVVGRAFGRCGGSGGDSIRDLVREAFFVPQTNHIDAMFEDFKREHIHMAIVVDEYGGTAGIVTLEDIVEEFFGEIQDEYDSEERTIVPLDVENQRVLVDAKTNISEVSELFDVDIDESGSYESVGGLVTYRLGHMGTVGEEIDEAGLHFVVREASERCVLKVEVSRSESGNKTEG